LVEKTMNFKNQKVNRLARCAGILVFENQRLKRTVKHQRERLQVQDERIKAAKEALK
jgi:hypothetical protein